MKFLFDIFPLVLFFIAWSLYDIFVATAAAIAATVAQVAWMWLRHRRVDGMLWATLAIMVVFGGAGWILDQSQDALHPRFIQNGGVDFTNPNNYLPRLNDGLSQQRCDVCGLRPVAGGVPVRVIRAGGAAPVPVLEQAAR